MALTQLQDWRRLATITLTDLIPDIRDTQLNALDGAVDDFLLVPAPVLSAAPEGTAQHSPARRRRTQLVSQGRLSQDRAWRLSDDLLATEPGESLESVIDANKA